MVFEPCPNLGVTQTEKIWVVADGEMGGNQRYVTNISAELLPNRLAAADCPALPNNLKPVSLDIHLWLGASIGGATLSLGHPP